MRRNLFRGFTIFTLALMGSLSAQASTTAGPSGTIHFVGSIIETPCNVNWNNRSFSTSCHVKNKLVTKTTRLSDYKKSGVALPNDIGDVQMKWMDKKNQIGMLIVTYK